MQPNTTKKSQSRKGGTKIGESLTRPAKPAKPVGQPIDLGRSYTTEQLCESAAVSLSTVCRWKRAGLKYTTVSGRNRYLGKDVIEFLHAGR